MGVLWRDFIFLILCSGLLHVVMNIEQNPGDVSRISSMFGSTHNNSQSSPSSEIVDSGFIITQPIHIVLKERPVLNDYCAAINSMLLCVACLWPLKVTFYEGDYSLAFRLLATQVFRSFCGWFTYLPVPHQFLPSLYDFPEAIYCACNNNNNNNNSNSNEEGSAVVGGRAKKDE